MMTNLSCVSNGISNLHHLTLVLEMKLSEVEEGHPDNSTSSDREHVYCVLSNL